MRTGKSLLSRRGILAGILLPLVVQNLTLMVSDHGSEQPPLSFFNIFF